MGTSANNPGKNNLPFTNVKIFSATMAQERENLGEKLTMWIANNPKAKIVDTTVTQSSDEAFHCLAITIFYNVDKAA